MYVYACVVSQNYWNTPMQVTLFLSDWGGAPSSHLPVSDGAEMEESMAVSKAEVVLLVIVVLVVVGSQNFSE